VRSRRVAAALAALVIAIALSLGAEHARGTRTPGGGTLTFASPLGLAQISLDPALAFAGYKPLYYATCATLMAFSDAPAPEGFTVRPEAAAGSPQVSRGGRTFVFTVRKGLRFSDGSPLTAANFARALGRVLSPVMRSPGASIFSDVSRVGASGRRFRIDLRKRSGDLTTRLALPYACPVPRGFPIDPVGVDLTVGSGPYYVSRPAPNQLLLRRNRYYRGKLPHRVDKMVANFGGNLDDNIRAVEQGQADVLLSEIPGDVRKRLAQRYGVDRRQLFRQRGLYTTALVLNTSSPLFRGNVALRKAVNVALDRPGVIAQTLGGPLSNAPTDQIVPSRSPGWVDHRLYPLGGPNRAAAQRLAAGHLRGGTALLYAPADRLRPAMAEVIADDLAKIGLKVEIKQFAAAVLMAKVGTRGEPFDMVLGDWGDELLGPSLPDLEPPLVYPDPANMIVRYLGGENARKPSGNANVAYFDVPAYNRTMATDARLSGPARFRAFSQLDADIMRNQAPWAPIAEGSSWRFVSKRVGCVRLRPVVGLVYGDLCLLG
jgi:peptide/nickel transport system substrate-binding protein